MPEYEVLAERLAPFPSGVYERYVMEKCRKFGQFIVIDYGYECLWEVLYKSGET